MKLIFLDTGDYLEFVPSNNKFIEKWFEYIFQNDLNEYDVINTSYEKVKELLLKYNEAADKANKLVKNVGYSTTIFENMDNLDQKTLNQIHKKWVFFTESYINEINPQPDYWHDINKFVHQLEQHYYSYFQNTKTHAPVDNSILQYLTPDCCQYESRDLIIHYTNLGRHQYNQWLVDGTLDNETNNYDSISLNFEYQFNLLNGPNKKESAPIEYVEWCNKNKLTVLPPILPIGKFLKYDQFETRKVMHRNLKNNKKAGFSYE